MKRLAISFLWFLFSVVGWVIKAAAMTTAVIYTARYLKVFWV